MTSIVADPARPTKLRERPPERGTLLLADISGYTRYLTAVELDHSGDIIASLLDAVGQRLRGWVLDEVEGDAIFAHAPRGTLGGTALLTAVEACYFSFAAQRARIARQSTCPCLACRGVDDLELKIVVHECEYLTQRIVGLNKLMGPGVILAHRLLKNDVTSRTGLLGYCLLTEDCLVAHGLEPSSLGAVGYSTRYDVGTVRGVLLDLRARWLARRRVRPKPEECFFTHELRTTLPASTVWDWLTDPSKLDTWHADKTTESNTGMRGVGTTIHCMHGPMRGRREIVEWEPYEYFATRQRWPGMELTGTNELASIDGETTAVFGYRRAGNRGSRMLAVLTAPLLRLALRRGYSRLQRVLRESEERA